MNNQATTPVRKSRQRRKKAKSSPDACPIRPRVKLWLELDGERAFCPGVCQILQEIERTGSIKESASAIGRSYRFVWGKLKDVENALGCPLVTARVGGHQEKRSVLTPQGQAMVREFVNLRKRVFELVDGEFGDRFQKALHLSGQADAE